MVATDTVVGIVGAVVLVAVMAGVFVYEYNNPATATDEAGTQQAHFEEDYAGLSARDDIDGDGTANFEDTDIDGDGISNTEDNMLAVEVAVSGSLGSRTTAAQAPVSVPFSVGNGTEHLMGTITYTRTGAAALNLPAFSARIVNEDGETVANAQSTTSGNTVTLTFDVQEPLEAGDYRVEVAQPNPGPGGSFAGALEVHYATPAGGGHEHS